MSKLPRRASAFAPGAITNFFAAAYDGSSRPTGATGGGYILSEGTVTTATLLDGTGLLETRVNGDPRYDARTTRRAVELLFGAEGAPASLSLDQRVRTPIGSGFGSSASAATSAVCAAASAAGIGSPKGALAAKAYEAEILEGTGLGTVSVIYDSVGAGAITTPGAPGVAAFKTVRVPRGTKIVTGSVGTFDKREALSSPATTRKIDSLGADALRAFMADPTLDNLGAQGERFSRMLGLESTEVKKLIGAAKDAGADHASQNMIGYSVHCVVAEESAERVARALADAVSGVRVDVFEVGARRAGTVSP